MAFQSSDNLLYLQSLPESSSFDTLPRRWGDTEIREMLAGTTLLGPVMAAKNGVFKDYNMMLQRYQTFIEKTKSIDSLDGDNKNNGISNTATAATTMTPCSLSFPSFEKFSDMLAAVTSRAFQITDDDVAIIPILDLGNHTRGKATTKSGRKNVSYQYDSNTGFMVVKSVVDIDVDECIRLTYGAKSNDQLLLNYGFCIPRNIEPDGSSNDILNFKVLSGDRNSNEGKIIALRAGPKSYSYGGFVATLKYVEDNNIDNKDDISHEGNSNRESDDIDFEDYLNQCEHDDEDGDSDDFTDLYKEQDSQDIEKNCSEVMEALKKFKQNLILTSEFYNSYNCTDLHTMPSAVKSEYSLARMYSTILSISELRTIYFFVRVIEKVQQALHPHTNSPTGSMDILTDQEDLDMIEKQTNDLANTYMAIHHGI